MNETSASCWSIWLLFDFHKLDDKDRALELHCIRSTCIYRVEYVLDIGLGPLTVITPSLIAFLFRITIPMGFRMNFFGMAVVQSPRNEFFFVVVVVVVAIVFVCLLLYLVNVSQREWERNACNTNTNTNTWTRSLVHTRNSHEKHLNKSFFFSVCELFWCSSRMILGF